MESLKVGFSTPKKWALFSALIKWLYGTPYSHVYLRFRSAKYNRDLIYQASGLAVNFMGATMFDDHNKVVGEYEVSVPSDKIIELMQFMIDNAGKAYSLKEAFGLGLVKIASLFGKKIKNPFGTRQDAYVCSVLASCLLAKFTESGAPADFENVSPQDLWNFFQSNAQR